MATRLQGVQQHGEDAGATAAVQRCWDALASSTQARLAVGDYGLTVRTTARIRVPAGGSSANEERVAVELRSVRGVALRAPDAWSVDPGSTISLGLRAGRERFGSLIGPAGCIDTGCEGCANVAFRLHTTAYGADVRVVAVRPIAASRLLLARYDLACEGGRCPACDTPIAASWVGQRGIVVPAAGGGQQWQIKCGRVYEATSKPLEGGVSSGWGSVQWATEAATSTPAGEPTADAQATAQQIEAQVDEHDDVWAQELHGASAPAGGHPTVDEPGSEASGKRRGGLLRRAAERMRANKARQAAADNV